MRRCSAGRSANQFWSWQLYDDGPIAWAGAWSWFDSFTNDLPANKTEASYFARPYTRMNPTYGGGPMLYPDGTVATGFLNNDTNATNPCNSRVYDAGAAKDHLWRLLGDAGYDYNPLASATNQPHAGRTLDSRRRLNTRVRWARQRCGLPLLD